MHDNVLYYGFRHSILLNRHSKRGIARLTVVSCATYTGKIGVQDECVCSKQMRI